MGVARCKHMTYSKDSRHRRHIKTKKASANTCESPYKVLEATLSGRRISWSYILGSSQPNQYCTGKKTTELAGGGGGVPKAVGEVAAARGVSSRQRSLSRRFRLGKQLAAGRGVWRQRTRAGRGGAGGQVEWDGRRGPHGHNRSGS